MEVDEDRLLETVAMLPLLHAPPGALTVVVAGPLSERLALEALKWRDVQRLVVLHPIGVKDRRIEAAQALLPGSVHAVILSPEQRPGPWWAALAPDGVISASTTDKASWPVLLDDFRSQLGKVTPWRNHLPTPLYGGIGRNGPAKAGRTRVPPKAARHLSEQYLPVLFTFARDELPLAFTRPAIRIANQPGSVYELDEHRVAAAPSMQLSGQRAVVPSPTRPRGGFGP